MTQITVKKDQAIKYLAARIAKESPQLADLTDEQLERIARAVIVDNLKDDLKRKADLARIDYKKERKTFLTHHAGRTKSIHTQRAYDKALGRLDEWAAKRGIDVLEMKFKDADDFIYALSASAEDRSPASIRLDVAAVSSFFTYLERRFDHIRNPFRGTKARPIKKAKKELAIPDSQEVELIIGALSGLYKAAAVVMTCRGLRVGALPSLSIRVERFTAYSKGKDISGIMPPETIKAIRKAKLDMSAPFAGITAEKIADHIKYAVSRLSKAGLIKTRYSVHDFRHYYAKQEYEKDRDIYRVKELLGHASIQVTEYYLKSLEVK